MEFNLAATAAKALAAGKADNVDPSGLVATRMMMSGVSPDRQDFKVRKAVVVSDAISMVDVLVSAQSTAKVLRHDDTMLKLEPIADSNSDVSI